MTPEKKQNLRMCAAIGAAIGIGPAIHHDLAASLGWPAALALCAAASAVAALATFALVGLFIKADSHGR